MATLSASNPLPWDDNDRTWGDQALAVYRKFSTLNMGLFPYRYAAAQQSAKTGMPIMRALVLDYQDDQLARQARNEYLFGPDLLVAPIVDQGMQRIVYLPQGEWLDYWTGKALVGGRVILVEAAIDSIPLYVRQGAILPKIPADVMTFVPASDSGNKTLRTLDNRRVYELYGAASDAPATIIDFEGRALVHSANSLTITGDSTAHITVRWRFQKIASATVDGVAAKLQSDDLGPIHRVRLPQAGRDRLAISTAKPPRHIARRIRRPAAQHSGSLDTPASLPPPHIAAQPPRNSAGPPHIPHRAARLRPVFPP